MGVVVSVSKPYSAKLICFTLNTISLMILGLNERWVCVSNAIVYIKPKRNEK